MALTWNLTVWSLMSRRRAMALLGRPSARSCKTSNSRGVRVSASRGGSVSGVDRAAVVRLGSSATNPCETARRAADGTVRGRDALRAYFAAALAKFPDLHFRLRHALAGVNSLVLLYDSVEALLAAEAFEFDASGKVCRVNCHYTPAKAEGRP